jgi:PhnB protein
MMADEAPQKGYLSAATKGYSPVSLMLYVEDADAIYKQAVAEGARPLGPLEDKEYGRTGAVEDPFGYTWYITTVKAD